MPSPNALSSELIFRRNRTILHYGVLITIVIIIIATLTALDHLYQEIEKKTTISNQNLVKTLELSIEGLIDRIDIAILASTDEISRQLATGHVDTQSIIRHFQEQTDRLHEVSYIRGTDEAGNVIYGPGVLSPPINNADRDYYIEHHDHPDLGLMLSKPIISRFNQQWVWLISRRIKKPDGSFGGVVFCAILIDQITEMFSRIQLSGDDSITLRNDNLELIARYPPFPGTNILPGDNTSLSEPFKAALLQNKQEGAYTSGATSNDGISRSHYFRRNAKYGFIINVGIGDKSIQTEWRKQSVMLIGFAITLSIALLILSKLISRAWVMQEKILASLNEAQEIAQIGSYIYNLRDDSWTSSVILDQIFGIGSSYPRDSRHWLALVATESRAAMNDYLTVIIQQRLPFDREYRIVRYHDGQERWVHGRGTLHTDKQGKPLALIGTIQDITEQKRVELALIASEARYRAMIETIVVPIALNDDSGNITFVNKAFVQTLGYTHEQLPSLAHWWPLAYPNPEYRQWVSEQWQQRIEQAKRNNTPFDPIEANVCCGDGLMRTFIIGASPLEKAFSGTHLVTLFDITERKLAEKEQRIAAIAFEAQEGMMITDAHNKILRVNKAYTEITGYTAKEVIGKNPRLLQSGRHDAAFYAALWQSLHNTGSWANEIWNRRKSGEIYPAFMSITTVKDHAGAITNYVATFNDITLSKAAAEEIERLAFFDPLTGLPNRRLLQDRLKPALAASQRHDKHGALLFLDLDNFKTLNDSVGHDMGDTLLQQVANRILESVRAADTVARLGGDEFVVMLEDLSENTFEAIAQTQTIANKILSVLNKPFQLGSHEYQNTSSIGATLFKGHEQSIDELMKQADIAMYQAKAAGHNTLRFFAPQMQANITARVAMETDLRLGIAESQFKVYYQAQVAQNGVILGAEALIRWSHPLRGLVSPTEFIALAEGNGLILPIGKWVLDTACIQIKAWEYHNHTRHLQLAVNVSARQFRQPDFVEQVQQIILQRAINPNRLKLELTETMVLDDIEDTVLKMYALRAIGVRFSMDDFGTGYSSLSSLKKLPIDQLKIDQSFVQDIAIDPDDTVIVQTIIAMANQLGMEVIAEGVETEQQRLFLEQHGCLIYQGYLFSKPVPVAEFEALLQQF